MILVCWFECRGVELCVVEMNLCAGFVFFPLCLWFFFALGVLASGQLNVHRQRRSGERKREKNTTNQEDTTHQYSVSVYACRGVFMVCWCVVRGTNRTNDRSQPTKQTKETNHTRARIKPHLHPVERGGHQQHTSIKNGASACTPCRINCRVRVLVVDGCL